MSRLLDLIAKNAQLIAELAHMNQEAIDSMDSKTRADFDAIMKKAGEHEGKDNRTASQ